MVTLPVRSCLRALATLATLSSGTALAAPIAATAALTGSRPPALDTATDLGALDSALPLSAVTISLSRTPARQQAFDALVAAQANHASPQYHQWLTAGAIGTGYGPSQAAINAVVQWAMSANLHVVSIAPSGMWMVVSGTVGALGRAFHTAIHGYRTEDGRTIVASTGGEAVPAALGSIVAGVRLNGYQPRPLVVPAGPVVRHGNGGWSAAPGATPSFTFTDDGAQQEDVAPADYATIYDVNKLRTAASPVLGSGETIAVVEDTDMKAADFNTFRSTFGLSSYTGTLTQVHPGTGCTDPGSNADEVEAALDAEWAGALAPDASIVLASCADTSTGGGIQAALQGLVSESTPPPVISVSYGECESELGTSAAQSWAEILEEASAEGVSVFVSSGDSGSAGCDQDATIATHGLAVNGLASSSYDVAVGGTDFDDLATKTVATYWNTTNTSIDGSAKSYVPETPWNNTCANPILSSYEGSASTLAFCNTATGREFLAPAGDGGGASAIFAKPSWQAATGVPADGKRDLPDVSMFAANGLWGHALVYCMSDTAEDGTACTYSSGSVIEASSAGGTSFAAPALAGIQALIDGKKGAKQGNAASRLYALASSQFSGSTASSCASSQGASSGTSCVFHDVRIGGNDQACKSRGTNCYSGGKSYGVLSTSTSAEADGYPAGTGYDEATGLGSLDVANLVNAF